jgi:hypothetical protein
VIQSDPELSKVIQSHPKSSEVIRSHPKSSEVIQSHPKSYKVIQSHTKSSKVIQSHPESSRVIQSHPESSRGIQRHPEASRGIQRYPRYGPLAFRQVLQIGKIISYHLDCFPTLSRLTNVIISCSLPRSMNHFLSDSVRRYTPSTVELNENSPMVSSSMF